MEKEFVPYEIALALKELGFNESCFGCIDQIGYIHVKGSKSSPRGSMLYNTINCPTFSQAFRFFREKYNIESHIKSLYQQRENKGFYFGIDDYINKDFYSSPYYSYEEAELECLKKLIEIIKEEKL